MQWCEFMRSVFMPTYYVFIVCFAVRSYPFKKIGRYKTIAYLTVAMIVPSAVSNTAFCGMAFFEGVLRAIATVIVAFIFIWVPVVLKRKVDSDPNPEI